MSEEPSEADPVDPPTPRRRRRPVRAAWAGVRWTGRLPGRAYRGTPRWLRRATTRAVIAMIGAIIGLALGGNVRHELGPFEADLGVNLSWTGDTVLRVPPLGTLDFDTHDGPIGLNVQLAKLNQSEAEDLLRDPRQLDDVGKEAAGDLRSAVIELLVKSGVCAFIGATLLTALVYRRRRETLVAGGVAVLLVAGTAGSAVGTFRADSVREPSYTGLLANAPALVGNARSIVDQFDRYSQQLAGMVENVSRLYAAASTLPVYQPDDSTIRVLHISDLHLNPAVYPIVKSLVQQYGINVVADTGDITDWGSEPETQYVAGIKALGVPYVYIRGNHDSAATAAAVAQQSNAVVLDIGATREVDGLTFIGAGDPRFTPDKTTRDDDASDSEVESVGLELKTQVEGMPTAPDITMVHDPISAKPLFGDVPLVLAGHTHKREVRTEDSTLLMVEGSTGGAGLRGLEGEEQTPLEASVLYFDATTKALQAYDAITIGGLGQTEATIQRHLITHGTAGPR